MKMNKLGGTGITVSDLCLGTMTYGTQTAQDDAFTQMDMALEAGINIFDTAEMYPVNPIEASTQGASEEILGNWFGLKQVENGKRLFWLQNILVKGCLMLGTGHQLHLARSRRQLKEV